VWDISTAAWSWVSTAGTGTPGPIASITGNSTGVGTIESITAALNYAAFMKSVRGVNIVAATINRGGLMSNAPSADVTINALKAAIKNATRRGIVVIIGAGNGANNNDAVSNYPPNLAPGNGLLVSTAATNGSGTLTDFSNYGKSTVEYATGMGAIGSGTDFSAAQLAGIITALIAKNPNVSSSAILTALKKGSVPSASLANTVVSGGEVNLARTNNILVGEKALQFSVETFTADSIKGFAYDGNLGATPVTLKLYVDGVFVATTAAGIARADLTQFPENTHGFSIKPPAQTAGSHSYALYATQVTVNASTGESTSSDVVLAVRTLGSNVAPIGYLDGLSGTTAFGWAYDFNAGSNPAQVRIAVDGVTIGTVPASTIRTDLTSYEPVGEAAHGFAVDVGALPPGIHRIDAYVLDNPTGVEYAIGSQVVRVGNSLTPTLVIETDNPLMISGFVYDNDDLTRSVRMEVQLDDKVSTLLANGLRADIFGDVGDSAHGYTIYLPNSSVARLLKIYGYDVNTGEKILLEQREIPARFAPMGSLDSVGSVFSGWVGDNEFKTAHIQYKIEVDGQILKVDFANKVRTDLLAVLPTADHAFNFAGPQFTAGAHTAKLWGIDSATGESTLIATKSFTVTNGANALPTGTVDTFNEYLIKGYASDPSALGTSVKVRIVIDDVYIAETLANEARADSNTGKGFSIYIPDYLVGSHKVQIFVLDSATETPTLIRTGFVRKGAPAGQIEVANNVSVSGYVMPFAGNSNPTLRLKVGGEFYGGELALNTMRADTLPGFTFNGIPVSSSTSTAVSLYLWDSYAGENVLVSGNTIAANIGPAAVLDMVNPLSSGLIYGWAIDTNTPGTPLNFIVSIDGVIVDFLTANTLRTDLLPVFGAANHGINYTLPTTVRFGTRRLSLNILDSQNGALTTIYDQVIIFS